MSRILAEHARRNAESRGYWQYFAEHRQRVSELLIQAARHPTARLCVLGAGNANDLDLPVLLDAYGEVHLVDIDRQALQLGVARQIPEAGDSLSLHGDLDLTGLLDVLETWSPTNALDTNEIDRALAVVASFHPATLPAPFDVVVSACLLTQLIDSLVLALGTEHARFFDLVLAVRTAHLRLLAELTAAGGTGLLITDVVSSVTCPELADVPEPQLPGLVQRLIEARNFFHGVNPFRLAALLATDPPFTSMVEGVQLLSPWRWNLGARVYAVCGISFRRRPAVTTT